MDTSSLSLFLLLNCPNWTGSTLHPFFFPPTGMSFCRFFIPKTTILTPLLHVIGYWLGLHLRVGVWLAVLPLFGNSFARRTLIKVDLPINPYREVIFANLTGSPNSQSLITPARDQVLLWNSDPKVVCEHKRYFPSLSALQNSQRLATKRNFSYPGTQPNIPIRRVTKRGLIESPGQLIQLARSLFSCKAKRLGW
jgi:hypothetical protein